MQNIIKFQSISKAVCEDKKKLIIGRNADEVVVILTSYFGTALYRFGTVLSSCGTALNNFIEIKQNLLGYLSYKIQKIDVRNARDYESE